MDCTKLVRSLVSRRQRDFQCCGWNSYLDYSASYPTDLPDTCCHKVRDLRCLPYVLTCFPTFQYQTRYGCGKNMLVNPDPRMVNTRGCGPLMKYWYRRGFWENLFMGLFGIFVGVYMLFVFQHNHLEFTLLRDEADDRKRIIHSHSMASLRSMNSSSAHKHHQYQSKAGLPRYPYTGMRGSPSTGTGYESDNNSASVLYQPRAALNL